MTDASTGREDLVRRALDYEIEPWTPDPAELIRGGRRIAMVRRAAAATAALAVAGTVGGVAMAVGGTSSSQPPVVATTPSPLPTTTPTVTTPPKPTPSVDPRCDAVYRRAEEARKRNPRAVPTPRSTWACTYVVKPGTTADAKKCTVYAQPGTEKAIRERLAKRSGGLICTELWVMARPRPTATIPTSVPAGL